VVVDPRPGSILGRRGVHVGRPITMQLKPGTKRGGSLTAAWAHGGSATREPLEIFHEGPSWARALR